MKKPHHFRRQMHTVGNHARGKPILTELRKNRVAVPMNHLRAAVAKMRRHHRTGIAGTRHRRCIRERVAERGQHFFCAELADEIHRALCLWRDGDEHDPSTRRALAVLPNLPAHSAHMRQRMRATRTIHRADEWSFEMKSRHRFGDLRVTRQRRGQSPEQLAQPLGRRRDERRQHMRAAMPPHRANRRRDLRQRGFRMIEIHARVAIALQVAEARSKHRLRLRAHPPPPDQPHRIE